MSKQFTLKKIAKEKDNVANLEEETSCVEKQFRLANRRLFLTYTCGHILKESYIDWIQSLKPQWKIEWIRLAHETGEEGMKHTHVVVDFGRVWQSKNPRFLDWNGKVLSDTPNDAGRHPNIITIPNGGDAWLNRVKYLSKEDPENADLKDVKGTSIADKIWKCKSKEEALRLCDRPSDATGILCIFDNKNKQDRWNERILKSIDIKHEWQKEFMDKFSKEPEMENKREVYWYFNISGNVGKTDITKYLSVTEPVKWTFLKGSTSTYHGATIIDGLLDSGWDCHGIIIDIPKGGDTKEKGLYEMLEMLKDGSIMSQKYKGRPRNFPQPHVIVFANKPPRVSGLKMDRWKIKEIIRNNDEIKVIDRNPKEFLIEEEDQCGQTSLVMI